MSNNDKVTVCYVNSNGFAMGVSVVEGRLLAHGRRQYAQYDAAPFVDLKPKGARLARRLQMSYRPYLVILEGWGLDVKQEIWNAPTERNGVSVYSGRYSAFDPRWTQEFDTMLATRGLKMIADYRDRNEAQ